ncbi:MAG: hypothetical protein CFH36_01745 [Alphaproteobacteria bacterium MarineAlpha9_Bin6]|nr:MAG: hypothetical protein CFH36_01745 [Alphaproteobacteria bacterium MarineAlpha9_Bin6]
MLTKANQRKFIESGVATRFGSDCPGKRCLAKNHRGTPCQKPAITGKDRCQLHGGKSIGRRTPEGKARVVAANTKHGRRSRAHVEMIKAINAELKRVILECRRAGLLP